MREKNLNFAQIYDLFAVRVIVNSVEECYLALGQIHQVFRPTGIGFDDYVANPKANGYQSLHTNVIGPRGKVIEVQIRTNSMHRTAEYGVSSHWLYKEGKREATVGDKQLSWLREVLDWQKDMTNPEEFLEYLKIDLFRDEVFVFTPKGELVHLPAGATPLDFAFAVHTDVGLHCNGSKVNGRIVPLSYRLRSGDEIEVMTSPNQKPSRDWIRFVKTSKARSKIRRYLRERGYEESVVLGKEILERTLRKQRLKIPTDAELTDCAQAVNFKNVSDLYAALSRGEVSASNIISKLYPPDTEVQKDSVVKRFLDRARKSKGVRIQGVDSLMFRFAKCCQPVPGEPIIGFVTRGRGITIHRAGCVEALGMSEEKDRLVEVEWDVAKGDAFMVRIEMITEDRKNVLRDILDTISTEDINIRDAEMRSQEGSAHGNLVLEIKNLSQLERVLKRVSKIPGVLSIWRSQGGREE